MSKRLVEQDFLNAAKILHVDVAVIRAVTEVESLGSGFLSTGQPKILFERHVMYRQIKPLMTASELLQVQSKHSNLVNPHGGGYATGATADIRGIAEHQRLVAARKISNWSALKSCSWGMFQIMGFHWQLLGYASPVDFVLQMSESETKQLEAFCRFVQSNIQMLNALRVQDWEKFAQLYNGKNYKANGYHTKLKTAYKKWSALS